MKCFENKGFTISGILHLTPKEAFLAIHEGALLVDVRPLFQVRIKAFGVPQIMLIPYDEISARIDTLPKDKALILADAVGLRSKECVQILQGKGFGNVANMSGGIMDWEKDGLPMDKDPSKQLSGPCACMLRPGKSPL